MQVFWLLFSVWAAVAAASTPSAKTCKSLGKQVTTVDKSVKHPVKFCKWYNSGSYKKSPLPHINAATLTKTCSCILKSADTSAPKPNRNLASSSPSSTLTCDARTASLIQREFSNPLLFCQFFNSGARALSPLLGSTVKQIFAGCKCILDAAAASKKTTTTTTTTTTSKKSSTTTTKASSSSTLSGSSSASSPVIPSSASTAVSPSGTVPTSSVTQASLSSALPSSASTSSSNPGLAPQASSPSTAITSKSTTTLPASTVKSSSVSPTTSTSTTSVALSSTNSPSPSLISSSPSLSPSTTTTTVPSSVVTSSSTVSPTTTSPKTTTTTTPSPSPSTTSSSSPTTTTTTTSGASSITPTACLSTAPAKIGITASNDAAGAAASASYSVFITTFGTIATSIEGLTQTAYASDLPLSAAASSCAQFAVEAQTSTTQTQFELLYYTSADDGTSSWVCGAYTEDSLHNAAAYQMALDGVQCVFGYSERSYADDTGATGSWTS